MVASFHALLTISGLAAASAVGQMPIAVLKPEYATAPHSTSAGNSSSNFVFLQKFPLGGVNLFFHTEVLVCPRAGFSQEDQDTLDSKIKGMTNFADIDESWWKTRTANCVELGYGGDDCSKECCGSPDGADQTAYPLNARRAVIGNADVTQKSLYIYGTGSFDGDVARHDLCDKKCWSNWAGTDYNPLTNNCNTFTSAILFMVYGLSQKKPHLGLSDMVTVKGHCPAKSEDMPIAELKPEYVTSSNVPSANAGNSSSNFVFLQKFPLGGVNLFFHTEVLVCPRVGFSQEDQDTLDGKIKGMTNFADIDESWWKTRTANCVEIGYGGAACVKECCGSPDGADQTAYPLNARRAVIGNADVTQKSLYIYGTGSLDGVVARHDLCDKKCWSNWAGTDYNPLTNNCNTFTSAILFMVYRLSQKKPHLGLSDMVTVKGHCPSNTTSSATEIIV
jgi:hypothetical protein